jgi:hypothetical protein
VIAEPWVSEILAGRKTWEMRTQATRKRGRIALIRKGSGLVVGAATLVDSLPSRTKSQMLASLDRHRVSPASIERGEVDAWVYPWVLADVVRIDPPMPYTHPPGGGDLGEARLPGIPGPLSLLPLRHIGGGHGEGAGRS